MFDPFHEEILTCPCSNDRSEYHNSKDSRPIERISKCGQVDNDNIKNRNQQDFKSNFRRIFHRIGVLPLGETIILQIHQIHQIHLKVEKIEIQIKGGEGG